MRYFEQRKKSTLNKIPSVWCFFKSVRPVCNHPQFDKNCAQNHFFLQTDAFSISEPNNCEVKENY